MKEHIKKFATPAAADGYVIEDIPWIATVESTGQNLYCHSELMKCSNNDGMIEIVSALPQSTTLILSDDSTVEILDTTLTKALISDIYKDTLVGVVIGANVTTLDGTFSSCTNLSYVKVYSENLNILLGSFAGCTSLPISNGIYYADSILALIDTNNILENYTINNSVKFIENSAFSLVKASTIIIESLKNTYTSRLYNSLFLNNNDIMTIRIEGVQQHTFDRDYNCSVLLVKGSNKKTLTYNIYTDNQTVHDQMASFSDQYTIINLYHLDGTAW